MSKAYIKLNNDTAIRADRIVAIQSALKSVSIRRIAKQRKNDMLINGCDGAAVTAIYMDTGVIVTSSIPIDQLIVKLGNDPIEEEIDFSLDDLDEQIEEDF